jgi:hypothetical protein
LKQSHNPTEIKIRPLSEGIGLGRIQSVMNKNKLPTEEYTNKSAAVVPSSSVTRHAQAAYAPHSVATQLRSRPSTRLYVYFWRFLAGIGTDMFVGSITVFVLAWAGILAWSAGSTGEFNPLAALITVTDMLEKFSAKKVALAVLGLAVFWQSTKVLLQTKAKA